MQKKVALFDFDGTIYKKDSIVESCKYFYHLYPSRFYFIFYQLALWILYKMNLIETHQFKERFSLFLKYLTKDDLITFWEKEYPSNFNTEILTRIALLKEKSVDLICISASINYIIEDFLTQQLGFNKVISNQIRFYPDIKFINEKNCRGIEKVNRYLIEFAGQDIIVIEAYSDNEDDVPMFNLAENKYKVFDSKIISI
jgi:HAD superfamily phosphoserine phosphatase-like hydrolase